MKILIKNTLIVDKNSKYNGEKKDILIENGIISEISNKISDKSVDQIIEHEDLHVSIGWIDFRVNTQDPGNEHKEDINSSLETAKTSGFTAMCSTSSTNPPISNKSDINYLLNKSENHIVDLHPVATISEDLKGVNISEMFDLKQAGSVAFSDNKMAIQDSGLLSRALLYAKNFDGLIMNFPLDESLNQGAMINESSTTTITGMKGSPNIAEELMVSRDLYLAKYHDTRIHIGPISCKESVDLIREAKSKGVRVTSEVAVHNLVFTDENMLEFDSNFKVLPVYRSKEDRKALINGVIDGTIDIISSDHTPQDIECKKLEFEHSEYGIIGLQTFYSVLNEIFNEEIELSELIQRFTLNPRTILKLDVPVIEKGFEANLTLFSPSIVWKFDKESNSSKSENSPFFNNELKGKALGVINGTSVYINAFV